jgi:hypothetical protein
MAYQGPNFNQMPPKDPVAVLPYSFSWANWLATGETISTATVTVPDGITLFSEPVIDGGTVSFYLSGGTDGEAYLVACVIQTSLPDKDRRSFLLQVKSR